MSNENRGLIGSIRQSSLLRNKLAAAENHGKRLDDTSRIRRVSDKSPLVYGSLDLTEAHEMHTAGILKSASSRACCIHALVQFPTRLIDGNDEFQQYRMLMSAVKFMNFYHGGDAVFAARLDRDETGRHTVDVFLMPRYEKTYKSGKILKKLSISRFSKARARARFGRDDLRSQGSALQNAWYEFLRDELQIDGVLPPKKKLLSTKDRIEPEEYKLKMDQQKLYEAEQAFNLGVSALCAGQIGYNRDKDSLFMKEWDDEKAVIKKAEIPEWRRKIDPVYEAFKTLVKNFKAVADEAAEMFRERTNIKKERDILEDEKKSFNSEKEDLRRMASEYSIALASTRHLAEKVKNAEALKEIEEQKRRLSPQRVLRRSRGDQQRG